MHFIFVGRDFGPLRPPRPDKKHRACGVLRRATGASSIGGASRIIIYAARRGFPAGSPFALFFLECALLECRHHEERSDVVIPNIRAQIAGDCFVVSLLAMTVFPSLLAVPSPVLGAFPSLRRTPRTDRSTGRKIFRNNSTAGDCFALKSARNNMNECLFVQTPAKTSQPIFFPKAGQPFPSC